MDATAVARPIAMSLDQLKRLIQTGTAYALVDPAGSPAIEAEMQSGRMQTISMYRGTAYESYTAVSPYLIRANADFIAWSETALAGQPWGIFVFSRLSLEEVFGHLQRFATIRMPDGSLGFFRFYDPRILVAFLACPEALTSGFWQGIVAYGWSGEKGLQLVRCPAGAGNTLPGGPSFGLAGSPAMVGTLARAQEQDFLDRTKVYLAGIGVVLPAEPDNFLRSALTYAASIGIVAEIDALRFLHLMLGWKEMRTLRPARELFTYPGLSGTDKVGLLCQMTAFSGAAGIDLEAHAEALGKVLAEAVKDPRFVAEHPGGMLTTAPRDARWRKQWLALYTAAVAKKAQVSEVRIGSAQV